MTCSDLNLEKGPSNPPDNSDLFVGQIDIYISSDEMRIVDSPSVCSKVCHLDNS